MIIKGPWEDKFVIFSKDDEGTYERIRYVGYVKLDEINCEKPWSSERTTEIEKWGNSERLQRLYMVIDAAAAEEKKPDEYLEQPSCTLPKIGRICYKNEDPPKFDITDGIHRVAFARSIGMDGILADVSEMIYGSEHLIN